MMPTATEGLAVVILLGLFACVWELHDMRSALTRIGDILQEAQEARGDRCVICHRTSSRMTVEGLCGTCADDEKEDG